MTSKANYHVLFVSLLWAGLFDLNVELEGIILDQLVHCLHFTSDKSQSEKEDWLRMWQN